MRVANRKSRHQDAFTLAEALAALAGALVGAALFGAAYETLQKPFGLPPLKKVSPGRAA
mgnify:CR=1 FL=1